MCIGLDGHKALIIEKIRQINRSATVVFLNQFSMPQLEKYLNRLNGLDWKQDIPLSSERDFI
jgi:hypothetical protein